MAGDSVPGKALGWRMNWWVCEWMDASGCGDGLVYLTCYTQGMGE